MTSRGILNNNPGNIDYDPRTKWQGLDTPPLELPREGIKPRFCRFKSPAWGIRAMARVLITYQDKYGLASVRAIVNRWAPPVENNTDAYIYAVANKLGVSPVDAIDVHTYPVMRALVEAIIKHENGTQPYDSATLDNGLALAGIIPKPKPATKDPDIVTAGGGGLTGGASIVADAAQQTMDSASQMAGYLDTAKYLFMVMSVGMFAFTAWRVYRRWKASQEVGS